tara:strand:+ start:3337 stop:4167 length:831 start_codon:yes stop_codon:yes gene_type:complete
VIKSYYLRLLVSLKRNGLFTTILSLPRKSLVIFRDLVPNKRRELIRKIQREYTSILPWHYKFIGGYAIQKDSLKGSNKVALCFGIYDDVNNEISLSRNGFKVYAFDPTPITKNLFKNNPKFIEHIEYHPWAVWSENKEMKFFYKNNTQNRENFEGTLEQIDHGDKYERVEAFSLQSIIKKLNINNIHYIKMDIEGAVPEVLNAYFLSNTDKNKYPYEISFELEIPDNVLSNDSKEILEKIYILFNNLKKFYNVYHMPDDKAHGNIGIHATRIDKES